MLHFSEFCGKSLLFIGPGKSKEKVDMKEQIKAADHTACLNDVIIDYMTDFYFVGEKFIYDYVEKKTSKFFIKKVTKIFLGLHKKHEKRIDKIYFKKRAINDTFNFVSSRSKNINSSAYNLPLLKEFTSKNMVVLSNLLNYFPYRQWEYIRSRTLSNALQVVYNLGFKEVRLIGFMDSPIFERANYKNQEAYIKDAKNKYKNVRAPKDCTKKDLNNSFQYQRQILNTLEHVYKQNDRKLINLYDSISDVRENLHPCSGGSSKRGRCEAV
jgi:hypothetical protein